MNFYKKARSVISLVCAALLILSALAVPTAAAETNSVTATSSAAVRQGDYAYCYVNIDSTEGLAALDVTVHYDPAKVKITDVYNSVSCTLYDSVTNTDNIRFSYIFDGQGTATKTRLFYFRYRVLDNAGTGDAFFDITVGEAYDSALNEMAVSGSRCNFTIAEKSTGKTCSVYSAGSVSTAVGQEFTLNYRLSTYQIASGTAVITYDSELFKVVKVTNGRFLEGKVTDVNADLTGEIYVSFVGTEYCTNTDFISVTFRTLKNTAETSKIAFKAKELLDRELNMYSCGGCTTSAKVIYDETYTGDSPSMRLNGTFSYDDAQITLTVSLEENSHLGAGDFVIGFDPALLSYNSCAKGFSPSFFNIDDKNVDLGKLKFHIISLSDIVTEETVLTAVFDVKRPYSFEKTDFTLGGTGLTDSMTEGILLNFVDTSVWPEYKITFRNEDGTILQSDMYYYGDTVTPPETPSKESDVYGTYIFNGWDRQVTVCTADVTYTATYTTKYTDYTVTFKNWDGTILSQSTYHYGDTIIPPEAPARAADSTYAYIFTGWDTELVCAGDMVITAEYKSIPKTALKFSSAYLTLQDDLSLNYKVSKDLIDNGGYSNPYVVFKLGDRTVKVDKYTLSEDGKSYVFTFNNITPDQMNDSISATLYAEFNGVEYTSETKEYSVAQYCYNLLGKYSGDENAKLRTLLVDLLNYGSASQIYTGHNTENLANAKLTEEQKGFATVAEPTLTTVKNTAYKTIENPAVTWKGAGLNLQKSVTMRFKIAADSIDRLSVKVESESGGKWTIPSKSFVKTDGGYYIYFNGLNAGQMSEPVYLTVYNGDTVVSDTICYSVESYAYTKKGSTDLVLNDLLTAMMKYGNAAYAYTH